MSFEIRKYRELSGISQQSLAAALNVDQSTVAKWESQKAAPRAELLPQIADILGCSIDELFGRVPAGEDDTQQTPGDSPAS